MCVCVFAVYVRVCMCVFVLYVLFVKSATEMYGMLQTAFRLSCMS